MKNCKMYAHCMADACPSFSIDAATVRIRRRASSSLMSSCVYTDWATTLCFVCMCALKYVVDVFVWIQEKNGHTLSIYIYTDRTVRSVVDGIAVGRTVVALLHKVHGKSL